MESPARPLAQRRRHPLAAARRAWAALPLLAAGLGVAWAGETPPPRGVDAELARQVRELAQAASRTAVPGMRVEIELGELDPRLKLAPCQQVQPYLPTGVRLWGKARIGLRCLQGPTRWNVFLPVTVQVYAPSLVATRALPTGATLEAGDLQLTETDIAADPSPAVRDTVLAVGRTLARPLAAGEALHQRDLRARQWFAAGDTVKVVAQGQGYSVAGEAQAMTPGIEGQVVRVRTENGRVLNGVAVAERQVEVTL
ncbi:flagellar basal body P-ring formation protein FlgA [Aquincola tertiaricarbonis]|uniref:Flagellar basal body P-ring formation protein FlgA n=1 Tax=Aquincola tertiaricarbonis TaxID=391953 RepID=A0ABY4SG64_AQUTE|nr:flagellar basal body P-ring formation chaperone FlgA [Aquincola tertiaricarbonis]URI10872.1 flagellar basal body P-ring formation protein FlgA [Aquincola tertiaricarbonis]